MPLSSASWNLFPKIPAVQLLFIKRGYQRIVSLFTFSQLTDQWLNLFNKFRTAPFPILLVDRPDYSWLEVHTTELVLSASNCNISLPPCQALRSWCTPIPVSSVIQIWVSFLWYFSSFQNVIYVTSNPVKRKSLDSRPLNPTFCLHDAMRKLQHYTQHISTSSKTWMAISFRNSLSSTNTTYTRLYYVHQYHPTNLLTWIPILYSHSIDRIDKSAKVVRSSLSNFCFSLFHYSRSITLI